MVQEPPTVPRHAVGTARPRLVRVRRYVQYVEPRGKLPCASGPYSPYVRYGGPGTHVSAQAATVYVGSSCSSRASVHALVSATTVREATRAQATRMPSATSLLMAKHARCVGMRSRQLR